MEAAAAPPARQGRPLDEQATQAILAAALKLLLEHGYAAMSMEGVAREAGVGKPAIYRRFANKLELAIAAIRLILHDLEVPDTGHARDDLRLLAEQAVPMTQGPFISLIGTMLAEQRRNPELIEAFRERVIHPRRRSFKTVARRGIERGEIRPDLDLEQAGDAFAGNILGRHMAGLPFDATWFETSLDFFWRGIRAESAP